jgi:glycerophosphoryl diester phosphodiesterase
MGLLMTSSLDARVPGAAPPPSPPCRITVIAHRGASADAPENTLPAVDQAADVADFVEVDVRMTRDGQLVVMHDTTLRRTTDVRTRFPHRAPWSVGDFTLAELRTLDAGSWFDARYAGAAVPTLQEVLGLLRGRAGLLLEVKAPALYSGMAEAVAAELDRPHSRATPVVVQSFDWDFMRELHRLAPGVPGGLLGGRSLRRRLSGPSSWAAQVNRHHLRVTAAFVELVHSYGMVTWPYTVDDPRRMRSLIELGVDGIITNRPRALLEVLAARTPGTQAA